MPICEACGKEADHEKAMIVCQDNQIEALENKIATVRISLTDIVRGAEKFSGWWSRTQAQAALDELDAK